MGNKNKNKNPTTSTPRNTQCTWYIKIPILLHAPMSVIAGYLALLTPLLSIYGPQLLHLAGTALEKRDKRDQSHTYVTATEQRMEVVLADGSTAILDAGSRLKFQITGTTRLITMIYGRAHFKIRKGAKPFVISTGTHKTVALGTEVTAIWRPELQAMLLHEGKVCVQGAQIVPLCKSGTKAHDATLLKPGQLFDMATGELRSGEKEIKAEQPFITGKFEFNNERLAEVVWKVNSYSSQDIVLSHPSLANQKIAITVRIGDVTEVARKVHHHKLGRVVRISDSEIVLAPIPGASAQKPSD